MLPLGYGTIIMCNVNKIVNLIRKININTVIRENEPLSRHNSFQTGGPADVFVEPSSPGNSWQSSSC